MLSPRLPIAPGQAASNLQLLRCHRSEQAATADTEGSRRLIPGRLHPAARSRRTTAAGRHSIAADRTPAATAIRTSWQFGRRRRRIKGSGSGEARRTELAAADRLTAAIAMANTDIAFAIHLQVPQPSADSTQLLQLELMDRAALA